MPYQPERQRAASVGRRRCGNRRRAAGGVRAPPVAKPRRRAGIAADRRCPYRRRLVTPACRPRRTRNVMPAVVSAAQSSMPASMSAAVTCRGVSRGRRCTPDATDRQGEVVAGRVGTGGRERARAATAGGRGSRARSAWPRSTVPVAVRHGPMSAAFTLVASRPRSSRRRSRRPGTRAAERTVEHVAAVERVCAGDAVDFGEQLLHFLVERGAVAVAVRRVGRLHGQLADTLQVVRHFLRARLRRSGRARCRRWRCARPGSDRGSAW